MKITTSTGEMILSDEAIPTEDDMNDIISSVSAHDDDGEQFQRLCDASAAFAKGLTCAEFLAACEAWIATGKNSRNDCA